MKNFLSLGAQTLATISGAFCLSASAAITPADATKRLADNNVAGLGFGYPIDTTRVGGYGYAECWNSGSTSYCPTASTIHGGVDLGAVGSDCAKPVFAVSDGIVRYAGYGGSSWGGVVTVQHRYLTQNGVGSFVASQAVSLYGHVAPLDAVTPGTFVYRGQKIAYVAAGSDGGCQVGAFSGVATPGAYNVPWASHLHFEIRNDINVTDTAWYTMADFNEAVKGNTACYNQLRTSATCRQQALTAKGYTDPLSFIANHPVSGTGQLIDRCISHFSGYFGNKQFPNQWVSGFFIQPTTGANNLPVYGIAAESSALTPTTVWYYWNGWGTLSASSCGW